MGKSTTSDKRGFKAKPAEALATERSTSKPQTPSWDLFHVSLKLLRRHLLPILLLTVLPGMVSLLGTTMIGDPTKPDVQDPWTVIGIAIRLIAGFWQLISYGALLLFVLSAIGGKPLSLGSCYRRGIRLLPKVFLMFVTIFVVFAAGIALLIAPGLIWLRRYFLAPYFMIDQGLGIRDALVTSSQTTKPVRRHIWSMFAILALIAAPAYAASYIPVVGSAVTLLLSAPLIFLPALRYQEITSDVRAGSLAVGQEVRR